MPASAGDVTRLLWDFQHGRKDAEAELVPLIYGQLRQIAAQHFRRERPDHTLQPTALVHEAYLRLMGSDMPAWQNRGHFFAIASLAMRRVLVEHARERMAEKRGGGQEKLPLDEDIASSLSTPQRIVALDEALTRLEEFDPRQSRIVELRFFGGMSITETAKALGVGVTTVKEEWKLAKAWLRREMENAQ